MVCLPQQKLCLNLLGRFVLTQKGRAAPAGGNGFSNRTRLTSDMNLSMIESPPPGAWEALKRKIEITMFLEEL